jgi:prefoldin subunit 5
MSLNAIHLHTYYQELYADGPISKIVEKSKGYLGLVIHQGEGWEDVNRLDIYSTYEGEVKKIENATWTDNMYHFIVPSDHIKSPGFGVYLVGKKVTGGTTNMTITTDVIYFKVDFTGSEVNYAVSSTNLTAALGVAETSNATEISALKTTVNSIGNKVTTLNQTVTNVNAKITELNQKITNVNSTVTNLNTSFSDFKATTEKSITKINSTISNFKKTTESSFNTFKTDVNTTISSFKNDVNTTISSFKSDVNTTINSINTTINNFKTEVNTTLSSFTSEISQTLSNSQSFIVNKILENDNWIKDEETNDYYQIIDGVDDITHNSKVDIQLDNETFYELSNAGLVFVVKQDYYGEVDKTRQTRIYSLGKQPEKDYSIQLEIIKLKNITEGTPIQGSPIGHLIDWNQNTIRNKPTTTTSDDVFSVTVSNGVCQIKLNKELYYE